MSNLSLKQVANGKTVFFNSPLTLDNELVRTGISLDNSFYHALLLAYTEDYSSNSENERNEMVNKFITSLNKKITLENWQEVNSKHKIIELDFVLIKTLEAFYEYLETRRTSFNNAINNVIRELRIDTNFSLFEAIFELISFSHFKNTLKSTIRELKNNSIREYKPIFINNIVNSLNFSKEFKILEQEKKKYIITIINNFLTVFFRELELDCFKMVKDKVFKEVNPFLLSLICSRFKRDLFIIDSKTKLPVKYPDFVTSKKSIVLLKIDDNFEPIGRLKQKNNIQYEFEPEDMYIKKLSMFLLNPEKFKNKYPELLTESKNKRNIYFSDSDSEEEKDQDLPLLEKSSDDEEHENFEKQNRENSREKERTRDEFKQESEVRQERSREKERIRDEVRQERTREDRGDELRLERRREKERRREDRGDEVRQERRREDREDELRQERRREKERSKEDKRESGFFKKSQPPQSKSVINNFLYQLESESD